MNNPETFADRSDEGRQDRMKTDMLNRIIARTIDFIIVAALYGLIPRIGFVAGITYLLISDGLFQGRSPGKRLTGLKVILRDSPDSERVCGFKESAIRNVPFAAAYILYFTIGAIPLIGGLLSFVVVAAILLFEILVVLGSEEGMRLGDELAGTLVVEDRQGGVHVQ